jgi:hypothetical protein
MGTTSSFEIPNFKSEPPVPTSGKKEPQTKQLQRGRKPKYHTAALVLEAL